MEQVRKLMSADNIARKQRIKLDLKCLCTRYVGKKSANSWYDAQRAKAVQGVKANIVAKSETGKGTMSSWKGAQKAGLSS